MTYRKGARAERELAEVLWNHGAAVIRSAGSGNMYSPDIVAIMNGTILAFECKAWRRDYILISVPQMDKMVEWMRRSGARLYIAWKVPYRGWLFIPPSALVKRKGHYGIDKKTAEKVSVPLEIILGLQGTIF